MLYLFTYIYKCNIIKAVNFDSFDIMTMVGIDESLAVFDLSESRFRFSESGFGFTDKSNGLDSSAWSSVTSLLFLNVGDVGVTSFYCQALPVSLVNPRQNWTRVFSCSLHTV